MARDLITIKPVTVNRAWILKGWGRMKLYEEAGCDPRTGFKALSGGAVSVVTVRRFAEALGLTLGDIIDLEKSGLAEEPTRDGANGAAGERKETTVCVA